MNRGQRLRDALTGVFSVVSIVDGALDPKRKDALKKDVIKVWNDLRRGIGDTKKTPEVLDDFASEQIASVWEFVMRVIEEYPRLSRQVFDSVAILAESLSWRQGFVKAENQSRLALWKLDLPKRATEHSPVTVIIKLIQTGVPVKALFAGGGEESEVYREVALRASELPSSTREFFGRRSTSAGQSLRALPSRPPSVSHSSLLPSTPQVPRTPSPTPSASPRTESRADSPPIVPSISSAYVGDSLLASDDMALSPSLPFQAVDDSTAPKQDDRVSQRTSWQPLPYRQPSTSAKDFLPLPAPSRPSGHRKTAASIAAPSIRDSCSSRLSSEYPPSSHARPSVREPASSARISADYPTSHARESRAPESHNRTHVIDFGVKSTDALSPPRSPTTTKTPLAHSPTRHSQHVPKEEAPGGKTTVNPSVYWEDNTTLCPDASEDENAVDSSACNDVNAIPRRSEVLKKALRPERTQQLLTQPSRPSSAARSPRVSFASRASMRKETSCDPQGHESSPRQSKLGAPSTMGYLKREASPAPAAKRPSISPGTSAHQGTRNSFRESVRADQDVTCPRNAFQEAVMPTTSPRNSAQKTFLSRSASRQALPTSPRHSHTRADMSPRRSGLQGDEPKCAPMVHASPDRTRHDAVKAGKWLEPDTNKQPIKPIIRQATIGFSEDSSPMRDTVKASCRTLDSGCQSGATSSTVSPTRKPNKATKIPRRSPCPSLRKMNDRVSSSRAVPHHSIMSDTHGRNIMMPPTATGCSTSRSELFPIRCASQTHSLSSTPRMTYQPRDAQDFAVPSPYPFNRSASSTSPAHCGSDRARSPAAIPVGSDRARSPAQLPGGSGRARSPAPLPIPRVAFPSPSRSISARRDYRMGSSCRHRSASLRPPSPIPRAPVSANAYGTRFDARPFVQQQHHVTAPLWTPRSDTDSLCTIPRLGCRELRSVPSLGIHAGFDRFAHGLPHSVVYNGTGPLSPHQTMHAPTGAPYGSDFRAHSEVRSDPSWGASPLVGPPSRTAAQTAWSLHDSGAPMYSYCGSAALPYRGC